MSDLKEVRDLQLRKFYGTYTSSPYEELKAAYQFELDNFSFDKWELPVRAARLSAAVKAYKSSVMFEFLLLVLPVEFQISPRMAKKLCVELFKRQGSTTVTNHIFGGHLDAMSGRVDKAIWEQLPEVIKANKRAATKTMKQALLDIEEVKSHYQLRIREKNKEEIPASDLVTQSIPIANQ